MKALAIFGGVVAFAISLVLLTMLSAWVVATIWGWFIVPTFGLKPLGIAQAMGISLCVGVLTRKVDAESRDGKTKGIGAAVEKLVEAVVYLLLVVAIGWLIHLFM